MKKVLKIIVLLLLASCEEVVEIDIGEGERMVVANALPCVDSSLSVNLTYSRFFLDNQPFVAVDGATLYVDINGTRYDESSREGANHFFNYVVNSGDTMTLHVETPSRESIFGGTRVPALPAMTVPIAEMDTTQPITTGDIIFTLSDPADQENNYYLYVVERDSGVKWNRWEEKWDTIDTLYHAYFNCLNLEITDPTVNSSEGLMNYFNSLLFSDKLINGKDYEVKVSLMMPKDTAEHPLQRDYTLIVESLSKEAALYIRDVNAAQSLGQYFAEPTRIYSNLHGGTGIFAGIAKRTYPLLFVYKVIEEDATRFWQRRGSPVRKEGKSGVKRR